MGKISFDAQIGDIGFNQPITLHYQDRLRPQRLLQLASEW